MKPILDKAFLEQKYQVEKLSIYKIAELTGWQAMTIHRHLRKYGIPPNRQYIDLAGQRFGKLTVLHLSDDSRKDPSVFWVCRCDCGKEKTVRAALLKGKHAVKSCGCNWRTGYEGISATHFLNIRNHAKTRGVEFTISIKEIWNLFVRQNKKCALSGVDLILGAYRYGVKTASLDRIDSDGGYTMNNVQWVHKDVNSMKSNMPEKDFLEWARRICLFNASKQGADKEKS